MAEQHATQIRRHLVCMIGLVFVGLFTPIVYADQQLTLFDFADGFDVQSVVTEHADVGLVGEASEQSLDVRLSAHLRNASIRLTSPGWDLSKYLGVAIDITNRGESDIAVLGTVSVRNDKTSLDSVVSLKPGQTDTMFIVFCRAKAPDYMAEYLTGMRAFPGGYLSHWITPDLTKLDTFTIFKARPDQAMHFSVNRIRAIGKYQPPTEQQLQSEFFPFVDPFGQYVHSDWQGKTKSQADIDLQLQTERNDLAANPGPRNRNRYGGWVTGPQLESTGRFRTQKRNGKWWFVDPEGRLFWSQGITGVRLSQSTQTRGRENYFTEIHEGGDFRIANLKRKFGADWQAAAAEQSHDRLRSWGINTMANWSSPDVYRLRRTPYVVAMGSGINKELPLQLDEAAFRKVAMKRINAKTVADFKDDPWCLGVFVDNELRWPNKNVETVADTYYKVVSELLDERAPGVLYLGSRIHGSGNPRDAYRVASKYCDVVSMNRYQLAIVQEDLPPGSADKPMIIGEFHFGALDRGLLHTGLKGVSNQQQRAAAYTDYVRQALENDRIVGAHWFQLTDQLVTGRGDGECYQIGFIDIVDRPYPEMIEASRKLGESLYQYRESGTSN
ncbi:hypothetical protein [Rhodopirellula sp. SWK7]|uniref:hypothetical protein n=1 Tax=Rhodopirellula sp. SWK7 TaxID=595460 RepID=UPI0005C43CEB|nr:hypothetical protein [Rhodopirellula sp. SWK7]